MFVGGCLRFSCLGIFWFLSLILLPFGCLFGNLVLVCLSVFAMVLCGVFIGLRC